MTPKGTVSQLINGEPTLERNLDFFSLQILGTFRIKCKIFTNLVENIWNWIEMFRFECIIASNTSGNCHLLSMKVGAANVSFCHFYFRLLLCVSAHSVQNIFHSRLLVQLKIAMTILKQMNACAWSSQPVVDILSALFLDLFLFYFFSFTGKYIYKLMSVINIFADFFPIFSFCCLSLSLSLAFSIGMFSCLPRQLLHFQRMIFPMYLCYSLILRQSTIKCWTKASYT